MTERCATQNASNTFAHKPHLHARDVADHSEHFSVEQIGVLCSIWILSSCSGGFCAE